MRMIPFTFESEPTDQFVRFGYDLYQGDPNWIPPLESEVRHQLSPEFAFFDNPKNRHRNFLAVAQGGVVGRVCATLNADLRTPEGEPVGAVGFFESTPDYGIARELLAAAVGWLQATGGVRRVWGPMNFDIWHGYRFMTTGFERSLFLGEPYNQPYYAEYFTRFGFRPRAVWDSVEVEGRDTLERMIERGARRYRLLAERGYRFEPFQVHSWDAETCKLYRVLNSSFGRFLGFTPVSPLEFGRLFAGGRPGLHPGLSFFAYNESGELAGFAAAFVDLGAAVRAMRGRKDWPARLRFLRARQRAHRINFFLGGITPQEEARGTGLGRAGFYHVIQGLLDLGYESLVLSLRLKGNPSRGLASRFAPCPQREYALYELEL